MDNLFTHTKWNMPESPFLRKVTETKPDKIHYGKYQLSRKEEAQCILEGVGIVLIFSYFFYRSLWAVLLLSPGIAFYRNKKKKEITGRKMEELERQFKETIISVHVNLQAGYSIENAFIESYQDMVHLFGSNSDIARELMIIRKGMANGKTLEELFLNWGERCENSEIAEFAAVFSIAIRTGGQWSDVIKKTVGVIQEKIETKEEIETLIHARKLESRLMCVIPFFILFYMNLTSKGYFDVLYHNPAGILIMTICMVLYVVAYLAAEKITEIVM